MNIVVYDKKNWGNAVAKLFSAIYPDWEEMQCARMAYDENHSLHVVTLLALKDELPVGQINLFKVGKSAELVNVGYHVHPRWQRKGVASLLLSQILETRADSFNDGFVIQTNEWNIPSKALAIKSGFLPATELLITAYRSHLKFLAYDDGVCFHLS